MRLRATLGSHYCPACFCPADFSKSQHCYGPCAISARLRPLYADYPDIDSARFLAVYEAGPFPGLSASLRAFKYDGLRSRGRALCSLFAAAVADWAPPVELVVPVTSVPTRLRSRGFNQAGWLAHAAAKALGVPCLTTLLRRKPGQAQVRGSGAQRRRLHGKFYCERDLPAEHRVLLVDDVFTTGATAGDCARALATAGAAMVYLATLLAAPGAKPRGRIEPTRL